MQVKLARPNGSVFFTGKSFKFTTIALRPSELKVQTKSVELFSAASVACEYELVPDREFKIINKGVAYRKKGDAKFLYKSCINYGNNVGLFELSGLSGNTTYIITAYAKDASGVKYGNEYEVTTKNIIDYFLVSSGTATSIKAGSASIPITLTERKANDTGTTITEFGVMYSANQTNWKKVVSPNVNKGTVSLAITGLSAVTKYYYKAYYTTSDEVTYSESTAKSFITNSYPPITSSTINGAYLQYIDGKYISTVQITMSGDKINLDSWCYSSSSYGKWYGISGTINASTREVMIDGSYYIWDNYINRFTRLVKLAKGEVRDGEIVFDGYTDMFVIYDKKTGETTTSTTWEHSVLKKK